MDDDGAFPILRGTRRDRRQVHCGQYYSRLWDPAGGVPAADDLRARFLARLELLGCLPADVRAEVVHHGLLPERPEDRVLHRLRDEGEPEHEVEDVDAWQERRERAPLLGLPPEKARAEVERAVGLGVERVAVEHDERGVDPAPAK